MESRSYGGWGRSEAKSTSGSLPHCDGHLDSSHSYSLVYWSLKVEGEDLQMPRSSHMGVHINPLPSIVWVPTAPLVVWPPNQKALRYTYAFLDSFRPTLQHGLPQISIPARISVSVASPGRPEAAQQMISPHVGQRMPSC